MSTAATARVTVKLLDQLSAPAQIVRNSLRGIRGDMASLSGARLGLTRQIEAAAARARELRSALVGIGASSVVAGYALKKTMAPATNFETTMTDIRQKADMSAEATKRLGAEIKALAPTVNQSAGAVAKGVDFLMGMSNKMTPEVVMKMMPAIGTAATAYRAEIEDLSKASFAVIDNMSVKAEDVRKALDVMTAAGKQGGFEIKDMAKEFPSLTAAANALGIKGTAGVAKLAAALQIARKGASDGSEAATNTANLMQKIVSPETTKKFAKAGIDIRKELEKTTKAGGDPFLMIAQLVTKATKGNLALIGDFFEDAQVQKFLRPLIENQAEYKRIRDAANDAEGVVATDYKIRMETFQAVIDHTTQTFERLAVAVGDSLVPVLTAVADKLAPLVSGMAEWVAANQTLAGVALSAAGGLLALGAAATALRLGAAVLSVLSLKGARGFLDYLAPKGSIPKVEAPKITAPIMKPAATTPRTGGSVPTVAAPGSTTTATTPRPMTAAEIATAARGSASKFGGGAMGGVFNSLKGGLVGGVVQFAGETLIDKLFDALPKPEMPAGYDPKAELEKSTLQRMRELGDRMGLGGDGAAKAKPLDAATMEQSRRVQDEQRRDPEGARGRAMARRDSAAAPVVSDANVGADSRATGTAAGAEVGQGIKEGLAGTRAAILAEVDGILAAARARLAGAGLTLSITPSLSGGGAALRGIHSDTGIN